jgi:hypothetical protein
MQNLIVISKEELSEALRSIVREELTAIQPKEQNLKYLSREEVCTILKISMPTLNTYTKRGIVRGNKIGNRILYLESDLKEAVKDATDLHYRRFKQ